METKVKNIIISYDMNLFNLEQSFLEDLIAKFLHTKIYDKIFYFGNKPNNLITSLENIPQITENGIYFLSSRQDKGFENNLKVLKRQSFDRSLVVFFKPTLSKDIINRFSEGNNCYDIIQTRPHVALTKEDLSYVNNYYSLLCVFPNNDDLNTRIPLMIETIEDPQNVSMFVFAQWKVNKYLQYNELSKLYIDLNENKLMMQLDEVKKDFSEFSNMILQPELTPELFYEIYCR